MVDVQQYARIKDRATYGVLMDWSTIATDVSCASVKKIHATCVILFNPSLSRSPAVYFTFFCLFRVW